MWWKMYQASYVPLFWGSTGTSSDSYQGKTCSSQVAKKLRGLTITQHLSCSGKCNQVTLQAYKTELPSKHTTYIWIQDVNYNQISLPGFKTEANSFNYSKKKLLVKEIKILWRVAFAWKKLGQLKYNYNKSRHHFILKRKELEMIWM